MSKSTNLLGILKKPSEKFQTRGASKRCVAYKEPRRWRSDASHARYMYESSLDDLSISRRGSHIRNSSSARREDLSRVQSSLEKLKTNYEPYLQSLKDKVDGMVGKEITQDLVKQRLQYGKQIKETVSDWCSKINHFRSWYMGRYMPINQREMELFANAKSLAESHLCQWYEPYHPQYWRHSKKIRLEADPPYDDLPPKV